MLLLKRFDFDYSYMTYVKINQTVDVPRTLQIPEVHRIFTFLSEEIAFLLFLDLNFPSVIRIRHMNCTRLWTTAEILVADATLPLSGMMRTGLTSLTAGSLW